jgi:hypothetical protein
MDNIESFAPNEDDHDLTPNHDTVNGDEEPVPRDAFKYIEFIIKSTVARIQLAQFAKARA